MSQSINYDTQVTRYHGPPKPAMPSNVALKSPQSLKLLCRRSISVRLATDKDCTFMEKILSEEPHPEFNGYNTQVCRESGALIKPSAYSTYQPLIDMKPSNPDTMMTALVEAQRLTKLSGQDFTVFTCDQQLYRVALHIT